MDVIQKGTHIQLGTLPEKLRCLLTWTGQKVRSHPTENMQGPLVLE